VAVTKRQLESDLRELIAALDSRIPRVTQAGEAAIAHDAANLRARAMARLGALEEQLESDTIASGLDEPRGAGSARTSPR
jgi:hypothetical protein